MTDQEMEILQGTISAVVFQNYENGYSVLRLAVGGGQSVTVVGTVARKMPKKQAEEIARAALAKVGLADKAFLHCRG